MNNDIEILDIIEFKEEIAHKLELDFNKDIFDLMVEVENIIAEKRQVLEYNYNKNIILSKLDTSDIENVKSIECYYISVRDNDNHDNYLHTIFDDYNRAKVYFDNYISTKTLDDWHNSEFNYFDDFCKPGDNVSQDIIDYFINSYPPITNYENFVQGGEPYDAMMDPEDNKFKSRYTTFKKENGIWIYKGNCFKNKDYDLDYKKVSNSEENEEYEDEMSQ